MHDMPFIMTHLRQLKLSNNSTHMANVQSFQLGP